MKLRRATKDDAQTLFDWRNDSLTRAQSINTDEVKWENHVTWLEKTLVNPDRILLVVEEDNSKVGTCRIDREAGEVYELSWTVAPEWRGKGMGKRTLGELLKEEILKGKRLKAIIKKDNIASINMAEHFGFKNESWQGDTGEWYLENNY